MVLLNFCQELELQHAKMTPKMLPLTSEISCWYFFILYLFIINYYYCSMAYEIGEKTFLVCMFCFPNAEQVNLPFVFSEWNFSVLHIMHLLKVKCGITTFMHKEAMKVFWLIWVFLSFVFAFYSDLGTTHKPCRT